MSTGRARNVRHTVHVLITGILRSRPTASSSLKPSMSGIWTSLRTISTGSLPSRSTLSASVALLYVETSFSVEFAPVDGIGVCGCHASGLLSQSIRSDEKTFGRPSIAKVRRCPGVQCLGFVIVSSYE